MILSIVWCAQPPRHPIKLHDSVNIYLGCAKSGKIRFKLKPAKDFVVISRVFSAAHWGWITVSTLPNHSRSAALFISSFCSQRLFSVSIFLTLVLYPFLSGSSPLGKEKIYTKIWWLQVTEASTCWPSTSQRQFVSSQGGGGHFFLNFLFWSYFRFIGKAQKL